MFHFNQKIFTAKQYAGTVLLLLLAMGAPLAAIYLTHPISSVYVLMAFGLSLLFGSLALSQWRWRTAIRIPTIARQAVRPK